MRKKLLSLISACIVVVSLCPAAFAADEGAMTNPSNLIAPLATNWFSAGTGTLNTISGRESEHDPISSGSVPTNAQVTDVEVSVTVSRGSIPFYLVVEAPNGVSAERYISESGRVSFDEFAEYGIDPEGTWYIYIYNEGSGFTDVSTASARMTVTYSY